jgi:putative NIF3 family GTP cyclohydrolase 1 type 2
LAKLFSIKNLKPFYVGFVGQLEKKMPFSDFVNLVNKKLNTDSYFIAAGPDMVKTVGIVSGAASPEFKDAKEMGADTYICGDVREEIVRAVEESQINFISAGHYNTEKLGVKNLGELISKKFKVEVKFIDIPNDI